MPRMLSQDEIDLILAAIRKELEDHGMLQGSGTRSGRALQTCSVTTATEKADDELYVNVVIL
jgi:hypothetical protein